MMRMSSLQVLAIAAPTAGAAVFEVALMQWRGGNATWPEVLGRIVLMGVASVAFSAVMFSLIERMNREKEHARLSSLLTQRTMEAQEEERRRLARELHDGVAQELYGLKLAARMGAPVEDKISEIMEGIGRLAKSLWPPVLEKLGLVQALRAHLGELGRLEAPDSFPRLAMPVESTLYRIAQEAVGNALRHGKPGHLTVRLSERAGEIRMEIEDDGRGFDPHGLTAQGLGLIGMRERAQGVGGTLTVRSERGRGTLVTVLVPREVKAVV